MLAGDGSLLSILLAKNGCKVYGYSYNDYVECNFELLHELNRGVSESVENKLL